MNIDNDNDAIIKMEAEAELKLLRAVIGNNPRRDEIIDAFSQGNLTEGLNAIYVAVFQCLNDSEIITSQKLSTMIDKDMAEYLCSGSPTSEEIESALKVLKSRQLAKNSINQKVTDQKEKIKLISEKLDQGEITAEIWTQAINEIMQFQPIEDQNNKNSEVVLLEEISKLAEENKKHLQDIDSFSEKERKLKEDIKNKNLELSDLKREIRIKDSAIDVQNNKIDELNKILKEERKKLKEEKKKNSDNQDKILEIESITEELQTTINKVDELTDALKLSDNAVQEQSTKIKELNNTITELNNKVNTKQEEVESLQQNKKTFEQQINNLNELIKDLKDKKLDDNLAIVELQQQNNNINEIVQTLQEEIKKRDEQEDTSSKDKEIIEELQQQNSHLNEIVKNLQDELKERDERDKNSKDKEIIEELQQQNNNLNETIKNLQEEIKAKKEKDKSNIFDNYKKEALYKEIEKQNERIKILEQELKAKEGKENNSAIEKLKEENKKLNETINILQEEINSKQEKSSANNSENEVYEQEIHHLNEIIEHLEQELKERDKEDKSKKLNQDKNIEKYEQEIKGLNKKIKKLESELYTFNELNDIKVNDTDSDKEKLKEEIKKLKEEIKSRDSLEAEFEERETEFAENIRNLIKENQELKDKNKKISLQEEEIKKLHEQLKNAEKRTVNTTNTNEVTNKPELVHGSTFNFEDDEISDIVLQNIKEGYPSLNNPMKIGVDQIQINRRLGGLQGITAICGNSQCGKTSLALQFSLESLMNNEHGFVLFYTSDHLPEEMYCRMTSQLSGIDLHEIQYGAINLGDDQIADIIHQACTLISSFKNRLRIISAEHFPQSVEEFKNQIEEMIKFTNGGRGLVVIDSMRGMVAELKDDEQHVINALRKLINTYSLNAIITKYGKKSEKDEPINSADTVLEFQADRVVKNKDTGENDLIIHALSRYSEPFQIQMTFSPKTCFFNARNKKFKARVVMSDDVTNVGNKIVKKVPLPQSQYTPKPLMTGEVQQPPQQQNLYEIL